jgi:hypothetical protein
MPCRLGSDGIILTPADAFKHSTASAQMQIEAEMLMRLQPLANQGLVPKLVAYGTAAHGAIAYIATTLIEDGAPLSAPISRCGLVYMQAEDKVAMRSRFIASNCTVSSVQFSLGVQRAHCTGSAQLVHATACSDIRALARQTLTAVHEHGVVHQRIWKKNVLVVTKVPRRPSWGVRCVTQRLCHPFAHGAPLLPVVAGGSANESGFG